MSPTGTSDALDLLRLEMRTLWDTDDEGRLVRYPPPLDRPAPLVVVAATPDGCCWAPSIELPAGLYALVDEVLADERADVDRLGWTPARAAKIESALVAAGFSIDVARGPSYLFPAAVPPPGGADILTGSGDPGRLAGMMPEDDRAGLRSPWAVALVDGSVAAVCETARSRPASVEAGVWAYEAYRRRGFASAATAAWSALVAGRTAFYSTSDDNVASMGVARRLGLEPLGQWWQVLHA